MIAQPELFQQRTAREKVSEESERAVIRTLRQFGTLPTPRRWVTGRELVEALDWPDEEASRRRLRKVAEANRDRILSGDDGYCLLVNATVAEVAHCARRLVSQGRRMIEAGIKTRAAFHRFGK